MGGGEQGRAWAAERIFLQKPAETIHRGLNVRGGRLEIFRASDQQFVHVQ
jgi:hypothetical protein